MASEASIFDQLKGEHEEVKELLKKAKECGEEDRAAVLAELEVSLIPHARGEEKTLYSMLLERAEEQEEDEAEELANEAFEEHRVVDEMLADLKERDPSDEKWLSLLTVIKENLEHHIEEEEEELFDQVKKLFSKEELENLLESYLSAKEQFAESLPTQEEIEERRAAS